MIIENILKHTDQGIFPKMNGKTQEMLQIDVKICEKLFGVILMNFWHRLMIMLLQKGFRSACNS